MVRLPSELSYTSSNETVVMTEGAERAERAVRKTAMRDAKNMIVGGFVSESASS